MDVQKLAEILLEREGQMLIVAGAMATECMPIVDMAFGSNDESFKAMKDMFLYNMEVSRMVGEDCVRQVIRTLI